MPRPLVLHVAPVLWSGAGNVITRLCETQRLSRRVALVTAGLTGEHADWATYRARLKKAGVLHTSLDFFHRDPAVFWPGVYKLAELLCDLKPAVVHAHAGAPTAAAVCARDLAGLRTRIVGQIYSWGVGRPRWMNQQDAWAFARADRVVSSSRDYTDHLVALGVPHRSIAYVPWGLPLDLLPFRPPSFRRDPDAVRLGFVGRIEPRKGQLELVRAFARLRRRRPSATLDLAGPIADPDYARRIAEEIAQRDLQQVVSVHGPVRDVPRILRQWTLFVSMSSDEGQGLAIMEAMALGVPVAARPVAGVADFLVDGQNGVALRSASPAAAARQLDEILAAPDRADRMARAARRMLEKHYAWETTARRIDALYGVASLLTDPAPRRARGRR